MQTPVTPAELIKKATALSHASTEKALIKHVKAMTTPESYAQLLNCLYGYYQPLEADFDQYLTDVIPQYENRRKASRILEDIKTLNLPEPEKLATSLPKMHDAVSALGCFYVLEGSVLGGAVLKKIIQEKLPQLPGSAFSFFGGYGNTMELWRSFLTTLNDHLQQENDLERSIDAANDCFAQFEKWIGTYYGSL